MIKLLCVWSLGAFAATFGLSAPGNDAGSPTNSAERPLRPDYLSREPAKVFELPAIAPYVADPSAIQNSGTRRFKSTVFKGNTVFATSIVEAIAKPFLERDLGPSDLEELRQKLTRYYVDRGFINSGAILAVDPLDDDVLVCSIVEGRLTAIRIRGLEWLHEDYVADRLGRAADGPLNVDKLRERFQLLLSDPLFARMNSRLMPGDRLGESVLDVDIVRALPYQLSLYGNNYRPPSIGADGLGLGGWVRNLTGRGDLLEASVEDSRRFDSGLRTSLAWRLPIGNFGTELIMKYDRGRSSVVEEPLARLGIASILQSGDIGISQVLIETLADKVTIGLNHIDRENRTWLLGIPFSFVPGEPDGVTRASGWRFWQEATHRSERDVLALRSIFSFVRNNLQDIPDLPASAQVGPDHHYWFWLGQAQYARQIFDSRAQFIVRGTLQRTTARMLTLDGLPIGGVNTVRGYRENQLIRDNALTGSVEMDYPLALDALETVKVSLVPFYDFGQGKNKNMDSAFLSSCGLAVRARWQGITAYLALAKRLAHSDSVTIGHGTLQDKGAHFSLTYDFF